MGKNNIARGCLTDEMLKEMSQMKGKTFKSYEYGIHDTHRGEADQVMRINLGTFALDFSNEEKVLPLWEVGEPDGIVDEVAYFECKKVNLDEPFPYGVKTKAYMIDERIKSVRVVRNETYIEKFDFTIVMDYAFIIETYNHTYTFSRGIFYDEYFYIEKDSQEKLFTNDQVAADWSNDENSPDYDGEPGEGWVATTKRTILEL